MKITPVIKSKHNNLEELPMTQLKTGLVEKRHSYIRQTSRGSHRNEKIIIRIEDN